MLDLVSDILKSPAGSFAFIFAFLMLAFFLVYKFSHFNTKFGSVEKLENNVDKIKDDISSIKGFMEVFRTHNNPFAKANSPISLTPVGIEVSKDLEIEKLVISHWEDIIKMFSDKLIKNSNPYDIQVCSIKIGGELLKSLSENELNTIKTYAYSKGHSLSYYDVLFGVVIRDHYFKIKGIDLSEIDKHDPNNKNTPIT